MLQCCPQSISDSRVLYPAAIHFLDEEVSLAASRACVDAAKGHSHVHVLQSSHQVKSEALAVEAHDAHQGVSSCGAVVDCDLQQGSGSATAAVPLSIVICSRAQAQQEAQSCTAV